MNRAFSQPEAGKLVLLGFIALNSCLLLGPAQVSGQGSANDGAGDGADAPILPGDVVSLTVWREEGLTGEFPVNQFSTVVLPMLGEYQVAGETHRSFKEKVVHDFLQRIVNPSIEVIVLKRVRVLGEVNEPGVYALDPTMAVADALAMAKGSGPNAREGMVLLRRNGEIVVADLRADTRISDYRIRSGDELVVPPRSWFDRNTGPVLGAASAFIGLVVALILK